jgi:hypothetical protein
MGLIKSLKSKVELEIGSLGKLKRKIGTSKFQHCNIINDSKANPGSVRKQIMYYFP